MNRSRSSSDEMGTMCEGTLVESPDGVVVCDAGAACRALALKDDDAAYRAAHDRVVTQTQNDNKVEYGGEA